MIQVYIQKIFNEESVSGNEPKAFQGPTNIPGHVHSSPIHSSCEDELIRGHINE